MSERESKALMTRAAARKGRVPGSPATRRHLVGAGYARGEKTRRRILKVAVELFRQLGYERTSTRAIACRARVSLPSLQYYFGSKGELYRACAEYIMEDIRMSFDPPSRHARKALATGDLSRAELLELLKTLIDPLFDGLLVENAFFTRPLSEGTDAFHIAFGQSGGALIDLVSEIVARILGSHGRSPMVAIRAVSILNHAALMRWARSLILQTLDWPDIHGERLAILKEVTWRCIKASLGSE